MHEASLMKDLLNQITVLATEQKAKRITRVSVWLGALSHMSKEHCREHFEQATPGSIAEGAELDIFLSDDIEDPNAQDLLLKSIDVETDD
jgi:hydrogenase nickel incorporation protein HypA/HybF